LNCSDNHCSALTGLEPETAPLEGNVALELLGHCRGKYQFLHPIDEVNMAQSTNDAYPTVEVVAKEGATHTPEFFSGSARAFAITVAHRSHAID
jgi:aspartate ammonia-lyase